MAVTAKMNSHAEGTWLPRNQRFVQSVSTRLAVILTGIALLACKSTKPSSEVNDVSGPIKAPIVLEDEFTGFFDFDLRDTLKVFGFSDESYCIRYRKLMQVSGDTSVEFLYYDRYKGRLCPEVPASLEPKFVFLTKSILDHSGKVLPSYTSPAGFSYNRSVYLKSDPSKTAIGYVNVNWKGRKEPHYIGQLCVKSFASKCQLNITRDGTISEITLSDIR